MIVPKKYIYISLVIFAFNLFVSVKTLNHAALDSTFWAIIAGSVPIWGAIMVGSALGFILIFFINKKIETQTRYILSKVYGIMLANILFCIYYLYRMIEFSMINP